MADVIRYDSYEALMFTYLFVVILHEILSGFFLPTYHIGIFNTIQ